MRIYFFCEMLSLVREQKEELLTCSDIVGPLVPPLLSSSSSSSPLRPPPPARPSTGRSQQSSGKEAPGIGRIL